MEIIIWNFLMLPVACKDVVIGLITQSTNDIRRTNWRKPMVYGAISPSHSRSNTFAENIRGTTIADINNNEILHPLMSNWTIPWISPAAYSLVSCGLIAIVKLEANPFNTVPTWFAIPLAALTATLKNIFNMMLSPWSRTEKPRLPIKLHPANENMSRIRLWSVA